MHEFAHGGGWGVGARADLTSAGGTTVLGVVQGMGELDPARPTGSACPLCSNLTLSLMSLARAQR